MAHDHRRLAPCECADRKPVWPLASGKQQMQLGVMGALRL
jgi:hypothetical protein